MLIFIFFIIFENRLILKNRYLLFKL